MGLEFCVPDRLTATLTLSAAFARAGKYRDERKAGVNVVLSQRDKGQGAQAFNGDGLALRYAAAGEAQNTALLIGQGGQNDAAQAARRRSRGFQSPAAKR